MIQIFINSVLLVNLTPIEDVKSIEIRTSNFPAIMERTKARALITFLYDCTQRCVGVITYNGIIIEKESINEMRF